MRTFLLVASDRMEFAGLRPHLRDWVRLEWPVEYSARAKFRDDRLLLVADGVGPLLAGRAADAGNRERVDGIVSFGFCGALNPEISAGDVFVADKLLLPDRNERYDLALPETTRFHRRGAIVSVDRVVDTAPEKRRLHEAGGDAVEMEAAALVERSSAWGVPLYCLRAVTDTAAEEFACDFNAARDAAGRIRRWKIVVEAFRHPGRGVPELIRLRRRTGRAATALGDFFADCRFGQ